MTMLKKSYNFNLVFASMLKLTLLKIYTGSKLGYTLMFNYMTDYMSVMHMILASLLMYVVFSGSNFFIVNKSLNKMLIYMLGTVVMISFLSKKLFMFFMYFEISVMPMVMLIMYFGSNTERLLASSYLFLYTFLGSLPLLVNMIKTNLWLGKSKFNLMSYFIMNNIYLSWNMLSYFSILSIFCWLMGFLIKFPVFGLHFWLPKAHVEASTFGSMILAGLLLKLGSYGFIRLEYIIKLCNTSMFNINGLLMKILFYWLSMGMIMSGLICFRQSDLKSLIAYSSMVHMSLISVSFYKICFLSILGGISVMLSHGMMSSGLFFLVGSIYLFSGSRSILVKNGWGYMNSFILGSLMILCSLNMSFPPLLSFFGEMLMIKMFMNLKYYLLIIIVIKVFIVGLYKIMLYCLIGHGKTLINKSLSLDLNLVKFQHFLLGVILILMINFF